MNLRWARQGALAAVLLVLVAASSVSAAGRSSKGKPKSIDLTKGDKPDHTHDWNLGATGSVWGQTLISTTALLFKRRATSTKSETI